MKTIRTKFEKEFGKELANSLESAAIQHANGINSDNRGSDPFKWVLLICIGYQCFEIKRYRESHGIKGASFTKLKKWIRDNADLGSHDGDCDYLALMVGAYSPFIKKVKNEA